MWAGARRWGFAVGAALAIVLATAPPAGAKVLPIASVSVSTSSVKVGRRFTVTVRFQPGKDFIDAGWENFEVFLLPAARADARGWPRSPGDHGKAIPIRRVAFGVFRGTAVVHTPGDYVVLDSSALDARAMRAQGIVISGAYASPVRVHVVRTTSEWLTWRWAVLPIVFGLLALSRVIHHRRRAPDPAREPEELVYAGR